jgi:transcriptional regulator with GAF, ATPase, and Fis domain
VWSRLTRLPRALETRLLGESGTTDAVVRTLIVGQMARLKVLSPGSLERQQIVADLTMRAGNQTRAARMLGMSRRTLISRLEALGIGRPRARLRASD